MVIKLYFNDRCINRIYCNNENFHRRTINLCIVHARKYRGYTFLPIDFEAFEERFPTLFDDLKLIKVSLGKGYHYEYYM